MSIEEHPADLLVGPSSAAMCSRSVRRPRVHEDRTEDGHRCPLPFHRGPPRSHDPVLRVASGTRTLVPAVPAEFGQ